MRNVDNSETRRNAFFIKTCTEVEYDYLGTV